MAWRLSKGLRNKLLGLTSGDGSLKTILANGQIRIFTGSQPASADEGETGTHLCTITLSSGAMTSGVATNGINLGDASNGAIGKADGEIWSGENIATGTAGWFRWYPNDFDNHIGENSDGSKARIDGNCSTSNAQMNLSSTGLVSGVSTTVDSVTITMPAS